MGWAKPQACSQEAGSPGSTGSRSSSFWSFPDFGGKASGFGPPRASRWTGGLHQRQDVAGAGLAVTGPTQENQPLRGPFPCQELLRERAAEGELPKCVLPACGLDLVHCGGGGGSRLMTVQCPYRAFSCDSRAPSRSVFMLGHTWRSVHGSPKGQALGAASCILRGSCWHRPPRQPLPGAFHYHSQQAGFTDSSPQAG